MKTVRLIPILFLMSCNQPRQKASFLDCVDKIQFVNGDDSSSFAVTITDERAISVFKGFIEDDPDNMSTDLTSGRITYFCDNKIVTTATLTEETCTYTYNRDTIITYRHH